MNTLVCSYCQFYGQLVPFTYAHASTHPINVYAEDCSYEEVPA